MKQPEIIKLTPAQVARHDRIESLGYELIKSLRPRHQTFVKHYMICFNATEAAKAAGYTTTRKAAERAGAKILKDPKVVVAIDALRKALSENIAYTQENALFELQEKIERAELKGQYGPVAKMMELKFKLTGLIQDKFSMDINMKPNFMVAITGVDAPSYAKDVTPQLEKIESKKNGT